MIPGAVQTCGKTRIKQTQIQNMAKKKIKIGMAISDRNKENNQELSQMI